MILRSLELAPFAGFSRKVIRWEAGLNVVLGPNDAGKSTLFRAIAAGFFLPTKVSKSTKEGRDLLPRLLPIGGDHARLVLEFAVDERNYRLEKGWGQGAYAKLTQPDGSMLAQEEKITEALQALLPAPEATMQDVLFMGQNALEGTLAELAKKRDSLHSLGDLLRVAVDQTGGVSVDRLKALLAERIDATFRFWDRNANLPERGKGIEDPWKKNLGSILSAYYARELARRDWQNCKDWEGQRDRILAEIQEKQGQRDELKIFVSANEKFVESASARQAFEARLEKAKGESEGMAKDLKAWLQAESDQRTFAPEVQRLEAAKGKLEAECKAAQAFAKRKALLVRFEKVKTAQCALVEARQKLRELPALQAEDLRKLRILAAEVEGLRTGLKAGKLQLQFTVKRELEVTMRKDLDPERKGVMPAGKPMSLNAGGRIQISSELFDLVVTSGDGRIQEVEEQLGAKSDALGALFVAAGIKTLDEAQERHDRWLETASAVKAAESGVSALLAGEKWEELESQAQVATQEGPTTRDAELVQVELFHVSAELGPKKEGFIGCQRSLQDLQRRYGVQDSDTLMEKMVARKAELSELEKQLRGLPELPESLGNPLDFADRFRRAKLDLELVSEEVRKLSVALAELNARLPEQSAQDCEREAREAALAFTAELAKGRALLRVEAAVQVVEGRGSDLYGEFRAEFTGLVARLSQGKYPQAEMQESLPTDFYRSDGAAIPYGWLSAGTKDSFALALRLAMARHFLGHASGFLLLDDPLVAMDPERQKVAAAMLGDFSARTQVIIFTCHPAHAELLGGNRIQL